MSNLPATQQPQGQQIAVQPDKGAMSFDELLRAADVHASFRRRTVSDQTTSWLQASQEMRSAGM